MTTDISTNDISTIDHWAQHWVTGFISEQVTALKRSKSAEWLEPGDPDLFHITQQIAPAARTLADLLIWQATAEEGCQGLPPLIASAQANLQAQLEKRNYPALHNAAEDAEQLAAHIGATLKKFTPAQRTISVNPTVDVAAVRETVQTGVRDFLAGEAEKLNAFDRAHPRDAHNHDLNDAYIRHRLEPAARHFADMYLRQATTRQDIDGFDKAIATSRSVIESQLQGRAYAPAGTSQDEVDVLVERLTDDIKRLVPSAPPELGANTALVQQRKLKARGPRPFP